MADQQYLPAWLASRTPPLLHSQWDIDELGRKGDGVMDPTKTVPPPDMPAAEQEAAFDAMFGKGSFKNVGTANGEAAADLTTWYKNHGHPWPVSYGDTVTMRMIVGAPEAITADNATYAAAAPPPPPPPPVFVPPPPPPAQASAPPATAVIDPNTLGFFGRFKAAMSYRLPDGTALAAVAFPLANDNGSENGFFAFARTASLQVGIKIVDGTEDFGSYGVFLAGFTNVKCDLDVTDTKTGRVQRYSNPANTVFVPVQDWATFKA